MDMYQKRKIRAEKKNNNQEEKLTKVGINWYPGHMAKTRKQIMEDLKLVDIVIELLDARIPLASQNPDIGEITKNKKKIVVLNKCDLADENKNKKWIEYFNQQNIPAVLTDANSGKGIEECIRKIEKVMKENMKEQADKGRIGRKIRAMIIGIPNVGKSSFINRISKKTSAGVGNKPGVTKQKQWIRVNEKIELLDTPGVLWPKFDSEEVGLKLAFTGTIKEEILQRTEIAYYLVKFLLENYIELLCSRYKLNIQEIKEKLQRVDRPENENIYEVFLDIGRKRGCIISGGNIDEEKTARIILDEFKNGKIGKTS